MTPAGHELVSVITPCYNAAAFIAETIESVARQTYPQVEHIVIDDCSTDSSWEVICSYGERLIAQRQKSNRGASAARNQGVVRASGEFLMFLDADDLIEPDTIAALVRAVRHHPRSIAICEWRRLVFLQQGWVRQAAEISLPDPQADPLRRWIESKSWVPPCAVLWRRDTFEETEGWDESLSLNDDGDLMMGALLAGIRLVRAEGGRAFYRHHGDARMSISTQLFSLHQLLSQRRVIDKLVVRLEQRGRLAEYLDAVSVAYHRAALVGYQQGFDDFARACQRRGEEVGGSRVVSRTALGRLLAAVLGLRRKEQIVQWLARSGLMTRKRRHMQRLRSLYEQESRGSDSASSTANESHH